MKNYDGNVKQGYIKNTILESFLAHKSIRFLMSLHKGWIENAEDKDINSLSEREKASLACALDFFDAITNLDENSSRVLIENSHLSRILQEKGVDVNFIHCTEKEDFEKFVNDAMQKRDSDYDL